MMSDKQRKKTFQSSLWPLVIVAVLAMLVASALMLVVPLPSAEELQEAESETTTVAESPPLYPVAFAAAVAPVTAFIIKLRKEHSRGAGDD